MEMFKAKPLSVNRLTIVMRLCCSRQNKGQAVGDLGPFKPLCSVTHSNGMSLAETNHVK